MMNQIHAAMDWASDYIGSAWPSAEIITQSPWSTVVRMTTKQGAYYLKLLPTQLALEPQILIFLKEKLHAPVVDVIDYDKTLSCFLMKDAGVTLNSILSNKWDDKLINTVIDQFKKIQKKSGDYIDDLIAIGVPDYRLENLAGLFEKAIGHYRCNSLPTGFGRNEIIQKITKLSENVEKNRIDQAIVQPDFNDKNTLVNIKTGEITFIDLGEISISHPFFALINFYKKLKLPNPSENNHEIMALYYVYGFLAYHRLAQVCGNVEVQNYYPNRAHDILRELCHTIEKF
jgi:hypothetical protein